ncbi:unnamed protein product [Porites lobata]|uniref:Uncharacterized protein n=1 Tax=Porites lobata TaxID=104759 RepID=A0ABN8P8X2_9CNID|nr:unnamed protein product [Porites lobata]
MQKTNDIFAVHLFHEEGINLKANEPDLNHVPTKSGDGDQDQVPPRKKVRKTVEKNAERVDAAASALRETQENLTTARQEFLDSTNKSELKLAAVRVDKIEKDLDAQLAELRRAQDALRKATDARKKLLQLEVESRPADSDSDDSTC